MGKNERIIQQRIKEILTVAADAFLTKGLADATMKDIARKTGVGRRTLYRYYPSKESLAFAVVHEIYTQIFKFLSEFNLKIEGTSYTKVKKFFTGLIDYVKTHKREIKFVAEFEHYFTAEYTSMQGTKDNFKEVIWDIYNLYFKILQTGVENGSIKNNIRNFKIFIFTAIQSFFSLAQRIVLLEEDLKNDLEIEDPFILLQTHSELFLDVLKGNS